jgi:energy-coupling factor transporter ATP-binding protein EcfA2
MLVEDIPDPAPGFGYGHITKSLLSVLAEPRAGAFVLGIHGPWGSGKSTLLNSLRSQVEKESSNVIVDFNAWKYQEREALSRALIIQVLEKLRETALADIDEIQELQRSLYSSFAVREKGQLRIDWTAASTEVLLLAMRIATANLLPGPIEKIGEWLNHLFNRKLMADDAKADDVAKSIERAGKIFTRDVVERSVQQVVSVEQFLTNFKRLVETLAVKRKIYVFIDDLDRCLPDSALEVFEAIKLFLDAPQCTYVVALDREVIRRGLGIRYPSPSGGAIDVDEYIEKTISLSFDLPTLGRDDGVSLIMHCAGAADIDAVQSRRIVALLGTNPRRLKRFGRSLSVLFTLAASMKDKEVGALSPRRPEDRDLFVKLALISYRSSGVFGLMIRDHGLPYRLQQAGNRFQGTSKSSGEGAALAELQKSLISEQPQIQELGQDPSFWRIISSEPMFDKEPDNVAKALRWFSSQVEDV